MILSILLILLLLTGSLFPKTNLSELAKISQLIEHYQEHNEQAKGKLSFMDFLRLHYSSAHGKTTCHHNLPFFQISVSACFFIVPDLQLLLPSQANLSFSDEVSFGYTENYYFQSESFLLQPPRI